MGGAGSKAAKRAFPVTKLGSLKPSNRLPQGSASPPQSAPSAVREDVSAVPVDAPLDMTEVSVRPIPEDEDHGADAWAKDLGQADALDRLAGSITNRAADTLPSQGGPLVCARQPPTEREGRLAGRMTVASLRAVLEEAQWGDSVDSPVDIGALAHRYGADEKLLREMLSSVDLPKMHRDEDGTLRVVDK